MHCNAIQYFINSHQGAFQNQFTAYDKNIDNKKIMTLNYY